MAGKTVIDETLERKDEALAGTRPHTASAETEVGEIVDLLSNYGVSYRLVYITDEEVGHIPVIFIDLNKFYIFIIILGEKVKLTGVLSLKVFEHIQEMLSNDKNKRPILIYYSKNGIILKTAYLFLGYLIEKHNVGILFVNGTENEIAEIIESLSKKGEFKPEEEDYIKIENN